MYGFLNITCLFFIGLVCLPAAIEVNDKQDQLIIDGFLKHAKNAPTSVAAEGWIQAKYVTLPAATKNPKLQADFGKQFLSKKSNNKWYKDLQFSIKSVNYKVPQTPSEFVN